MLLLLLAIEVTYTGTTTRVVPPGRTADVFELLCDDHEEIDFTVNPMKSRRMRTEKISDLNFVGDITLLSDDLSTVQELHLRVETECKKQGFI